VRRPAGPSASRASDPALSLWLRLLKLHNLVQERVRRGLAGWCTLPQFDVLAQLARVPEGLTFRELSRRLLVSAGNLTGIVDRLESEGLVHREVVAHDRRSYRVRLTSAGRRRIGALIPRHRRDLASIFSKVPLPRQRALRRLLGEAARAVENGAAGGAPHRRRGGRRVRSRP
jgi:DNA-binding MarR family transcriptional regulator